MIADLPYMIAGAITLLLGMALARKYGMWRGIGAAVAVFVLFVFVLFAMGYGY